MPFTLNGQTREDGSFAATAQGKAPMTEVRRAVDLPLFDHLSGNAAWQAGLSVKSGATSFTLESSLQGVASSLPPPFNKSATEALPLRFEYAPVSAGRAQLRASLGRVASAQLIKRTEGAAFERGVIALGEPASLPERGVLLQANLKTLDVDTWRGLLSSGDKAASPPPVTQVVVKAGSAQVFGQSFNDLIFQASLSEANWAARINSREAVGEVNYRTTGKGRVVARFGKLSVGELRADGRGGSATAAEDTTELPALDVVVDQFSLKGRALGKLDLQAANRGAVWRMEKLALSSPDGSITGEGQWRTQAAAKPGEPATQVNLKIESGNIGRLLDRMGYPDTLRRGNGRLEAKLSWAGPPTSIDYPTLAGEVKLDAASGQFSKLEPGVGRLLGVVSLQSLPRRISLDFRDVFSEGFAWDSISGSMKIAKGVMASEDFRIRGPSARVSMKGEVDLARETQNLRVKVQPTLSESVALGAAIANPVVGVATYLAQKVLRDPFEKMFTFDYAVSGSWADPKVVKLGAEDKPGPSP
jgi:uncharacterized protein (TIGR02099 family)